MISSKGYAAMKAGGPLLPFKFSRRELGPHDLLIDILYCGICHSDIHKVNDDWGSTTYPIVPGHEIVGRVSRVGSSVKRFKVGDNAGVGCMVESCRKCEACKAGEEQYCKDGTTMTYNSPETHIGGMTFGGYSNNIVVDEGFALKVPKNVDLAATAPLLCAGITTYSPLRRWKVGRGQKVGVFGMGGLGHMAVKFARSFGAHVVVFTTSPDKIKDAKRFGAHEVVLSTDAKEMPKHEKSLDFILDTISAQHDVDAVLSLLKRNGHMVLVGLSGKPVSVSASSLIYGHRSFAGSLIGGIKETQEMLDYCAKHNITCDIELIPIQRLAEAYRRTLSGDVKYRFVIDMSSLR
jgi:uncharacterized zinc-type alcohol dehydrogenase-like protein